MKITTITTMAALLMGAASAVAQDTAYTKPAGFVTHTLKAGQFNLIGLTLHQPVTVAGDFETVSGTSLSDTDVDFSSTLTDGKTYIMEITDAADTELNGHVQEVTVWSNNTITTNDDMDAQGLAVGDKYQLRAASTISDIFGADNSAGLLATDEFKADEADVVYVPNGTGFDTYFYSDLTGATGWYKSDFTAAENTPIAYMDSVLILRRAATDLDLVMTGSVKTISSTLALGAGTFNYVSTTFPVGSTFGNSGLEATLTGTDEFKADEADVVYMPNATGGYDSYFYSNLSGATGWYKSDFSDATNVEITAGMIILRRGGAVNATIVPPSSYSNL